MTREWLEAKKKALIAEHESIRNGVIEKINSFPNLTEEVRQAMINYMDNDEAEDPFDDFLDDNKADEGQEDRISPMDLFDQVQEASFHRIKTDEWIYGMENYLDTEKIEMDGTIVITDPGYLIRIENEISDCDWYLCDLGRNMRVLGFERYLSANTLCGDCSCTTISTDTGEVIGEFCADGGTVGVFLLDEIFKYNPDFKWHITNPEYVTLIPDFKGTVQIVVEYEEGVYEDATEYHKVGDKWENYSVHVVGHGADKETGKEINFTTRWAGY